MIKMGYFRGECAIRTAAIAPALGYSTWMAPLGMVGGGVEKGGWGRGHPSTLTLFRRNSIESDHSVGMRYAPTPYRHQIR